ncbi:MAG: BCD family MFS transporter [Parvularculaceae bacterium]|nr:BCD family MFS transporter [Parvularculaceae bacterium]
MKRAGELIGWLGIVRLGLIQASLGAVVVLATSTLNRIMIVELALPALIPGALVGWHYGVQLSRPRWGHGADVGGRRSPWIFGGILTLAAGGTAAAASMALMQSSFAVGLAAAFVAFFVIGVGVGASGTNLLALLATKVPPARKAAAAAIVWIMMIFGFVVTSITAGSLLDPFSMGRLISVSAGVGLVAIILTAFALFGMEGRERPTAPAARSQAFLPALREVWSDPQARRFTLFVFVSMIAYSAQDLILEPLGGLLYDMTPGETTKLSGMQNGGVLLGMIATAIVGSTIGKSNARFMRQLTMLGCIASAVALGALSYAAMTSGSVPLPPLVFTLGVANGAFAVAAIGSMMTLASAGAPGREGMRMGVWGASQAIAFGLGGFLGAVSFDIARGFLQDPGSAFALVFSIEAAAFLIAAVLAMRVGRTSADELKLPAMPTVDAVAAE